MLLDDQLRRFKHLENRAMHGIRPRQDYESGDEGYQNDGPDTKSGSVLGGQSIGGNGATASYATGAFPPEAISLPPDWAARFRSI